MKTDKLLKQFRLKGLKLKNSSESTLDDFKKKSNLKPIDSGMLISIKGGLNTNPPIRGN